MHHHLRDGLGFFCGHLDFPFVEYEARIYIINSLLTKLIRQALNDNVVQQENIKDLDYLREKFQDGARIFTIEGSVDTGFQFIYLQFHDKIQWVDQKGNFIRPYLPSRDLQPLFFEQNVIPVYGYTTAFNYYYFINKSISKLNEKKRLSGLLCVEELPQILVNFASNDQKDYISEDLSFDFVDLNKKPRTIMKCESNPLLILNSSFKSRDNEVRNPNNNIKYILTLIEFTRHHNTRAHLATFDRNNILQNLRKAKGSIIISFRDSAVSGMNRIEKLNSEYFNLQSSAPRKTVIISKVDLNLYDPQEPEKITWIDDRSVYYSIKALKAYLNSLSNGFDLEIALFRRFKFYKLISLSITSEFQSAILEELCEGQCNLIDGFRGINNYDISSNEKEHITASISDLLTKIRQTILSKVTLNSYNLVVIPYFIRSNSSFISKLPAVLSAKLITWDEIGENSKRIAVFDYFDLDDRLLNIFNIQKKFEKVDLIFLSALFKPLYQKNKLKTFNGLLESYNIIQYPLRKSILNFEEESRANIERHLQLKEVKDVRTEEMIDLSELPGEYDEDHDPQKYQVITDKGTSTVYGHEKVLIKLQSNWQIQKYAYIYELLTASKNLSLEIVDGLSVIAQLSKGKKAKTFSWRKPLREKTSKLGVSESYNTLTKFSEDFGGRMVSREWFEKDWLSEDDTDSSIPKHRSNLKAVGKFLDFTDDTLLAILRINLLERMESADVNKSILILLNDLMNLSSHYRNKSLDIPALVSRFMNDSSFANSMSIFKKYISLSESSAEIENDLRKFFSDCFEHIQVKLIKKINTI